MSIELDATRPKWRQVAEILRARIADGTYPPGSRIPAVVTLSAEFGIALVTAQKVTRALRDEGLIRTEIGMGSYVTGLPPR
ncbi:GntR family transcriptional regulator [Streptomyces fulvorobeus]|uniref:DNA-binding GntR family transcriptional regulator n=1 Tax=Streptomyces fulvorobeus TaxID=284028 RepID=A0A7Y9HGT8_9ACTN|nr:winged helix-turn-helix domain-containing protein [Streptomyces fulvorobeus]NYE44271.1 DNA-binding GntR family transcriptional regulator [Streptomyces fulvorobeus]